MCLAFMDFSLFYLLFALISYVFYCKACVTEFIIIIIMSILKFLPGASVGAGVGASCAAAEADHPASQLVGQHPRLAEAVHRFGPHSPLLLPV